MSEELEARIEELDGECRAHLDMIGQLREELAGVRAENEALRGHAADLATEELSTLIVECWGMDSDEYGASVAVRRLTQQEKTE